MQELEHFKPFIGAKKLNIGCAGNKVEGYDNLDADPRTNPDILCSLGAEPIPVPDNTYDTIMASHVLEHIPQERLFAVFNELFRVLKPGGFLIAVTPYGSSDDAWENPHHRQCFTENTYPYFSKRLYEYQAGNAGFKAYEGKEYSDWTIMQTWFVPYPEFRNDPEINFKKRHYRNVIQELQVVLVANK